ncbi:hypothetical protein NPX79_00915 [Spiroplasma endosymbiont of Anurida maritima]|uniref:hypothetical protein n=1 Tax=Spiroplasma endosymbiont of Anurida maritima TaxID=2967972 RepID=UPI0036D2177D
MMHNIELILNSILYNLNIYVITLFFLVLSYKYLNNFYSFFKIDYKNKSLLKNKLLTFLSVIIMFVLFFKSFFLNLEGTYLIVDVNNYLIFTIVLLYAFSFMFEGNKAFNLFRVYSLLSFIWIIIFFNLINMFTFFINVYNENFVLFLFNLLVFILFHVYYLKIVFKLEHNIRKNILKIKFFKKYKILNNTTVKFLRKSLAKAIIINYEKNDNLFSQKEIQHLLEFLKSDSIEIEVETVDKDFLIPLSKK